MLAPMSACYLKISDNVNGSDGQSAWTTRVGLDDTLSVGQGIQAGSDEKSYALLLECVMRVGFPFSRFAPHAAHLRDLGQISKSLMKVVRPHINRSKF